MATLYDSCIIDLSKRGFSPAAAARACAIATYKKTGLTPTDPALKSEKGSVSKDAEKIATSLSSGLVNFHKLSGHDHFRVSISDAFSFSYSEDGIDNSGVDPFEPMYISERGYSPRMLREVFLIRKGKFNEIEFDDSDLQALIDNWDRPVPFQIDHKTDYNSGIGSLLAVRKQGSRVYGLAEFVGYSAISDIRSGKAKEVSIGFYLKPRKLVEVSLTRFPAVGGKDPAQILNPSFDPKKPTQSNPFYSSPELQELLNQFQQLGQPAGQLEPELDQSPALLTTPETQPEPAIIRLENFGGPTPAKGNQDMDPIQFLQQQIDALKSSQKTPEAKPTEPVTQPDPKLNFGQDQIMAQFNTQLQQLSAKLEKSEAEKAELSETVKAQGQTMKLQRNTQIILQFATEGLMLTANKDDELGFIGSLSDEQLAQYCKIKKANGPVIKLGARESEPDKGAPEGQTTPVNRSEQKGRLSVIYSGQDGVEKAKDTGTKTA